MKKQFDLIIVPFCLAILVFILVAIWLKLDNSLPHWDMGRHLFTVLTYRDLLQAFFKGEKSFPGLISFYSYYPPAVYYVSLFVQKIFGFSQDKAVWSNIVWILITAYSIYGIGKSLWSKTIGFFSMLIFFSFPIIIGQIREFQIDFPLTAMVILAYYFILKTSNFSNRKNSIYLGFILGLGMMTKWTFSAFLILPLVWTLIAGLKTQGRKQVLLNFLISAGIGLVIMFPWYWRNLDSLHHDFSQNGVNVAQIEGDPVGINFASLRWYYDRLLNNYLFLPFFIGLIIGIVSKIFDKRGRHLLIWAVFAYCVFWLLPNKDVRYIMPIAPILALMIGSSIELFQSRSYRFAIILTICIFCVLNNAYVAFASYLPYSYKPITLAKMPVLVKDGYTSNSPVENPVCPMANIINTIPKGKSARLVGTNNIDFTDWAVAYYLGSNGRSWSGQIGDPFQLSDYLIVRKAPGDNWFTLNQNSLAAYPIVQEFTCRDQGTVLIYKIHE